MDRRAFFTKGVGKAAQAISKHAVEKARQRAVHWIRPPFAIEELDFLLACTRCGDCIDACPHDIIFPLPSRLGVKVISTPALDLANNGCHLCEGWPCVESCKTGAMQLPQLEGQGCEGQTTKAEAPATQSDKAAETVESELVEHNMVNGAEYSEKQLPRIASVYINKKTCLPYSGPECGACRVCPVEGAMSWNMDKPEINQRLCTGCALCREACIVDPKAIVVQSKYK